MKLSGVIAELRNNELRAGGYFLFQFEILRHLFGFRRLKRRHDRAGEKITCLMTNNPFDSRILQAFVHLRYQLQNMNRIQIKYRSRSPLIAGHGIITAHHQNVSDPRPVQGIELALDLIAVFIFAGKMNERFDPELDDFSAHKISRHGGRPAGIVCQCKRADFAADGRLLRQSQRLFLCRFSCSPSRHELPGHRKQGRIQQSFFKKIFPHRHPLSTYPLIPFDFRE
ncbi:MAG: hypothetical protein BWX55_00382 [Deltaproteobacteria bacterium ADurb.Bin022]|nr:MAG: hypothetical protein BWX55_00382 [Deltaproteobacteria bacterium ADurb.Bin022]